MKVNTSRFGELEVNTTDIITFNEGLLGFETLKKYFIVDPGDSTLILWLQSIDNDKIAFPIIEPKIFKHDYVAKLLPADLNGLQLENFKNAKLYSIITIPANVAEMTANMKAPVVINMEKKIGKQIVLQDSKLNVKHEMYKELRSFIVNFSSDDSKRTNFTPSIELDTADEKMSHQFNSSSRDTSTELN